MTDDVRAALRALATGRGATDERAAATVADATAACDDVRDAAGFVADGGLDRLRDAVDRTECAGDRPAARRGRRALDELERCRRAAADHFRPGHGTVLSPGDQRSDR